ncbi:hypothetical protein [Myceligenerans crystallogenes]|uniref:PGAP1-like protein n=1 Tax=Myceligenerans crystallogenes TaxID=316335 RepID=A0ABP4ZTQ7_9MICO
MPGSTAAQLWGQDIEQVRDLARTFREHSRQLDAARETIGHAVLGFEGYGPDVDVLREIWSGDLAPAMARIAAALHEAGDVAERNAGAQEETSADDGREGTAVSGDGGGGGNGGGTAAALFPGGPAGDFAGSTGRPGDHAPDLAGWHSGPGSVVADSWDNLLDAGGQLWDATGGSILEGRWPRTTEIVASGALFGGALADTALTTGTGGRVDLDLFDDGEPVAGEPVAVDLDREGHYPRDLEDLVSAVEDTSGPEVRVTTIETARGPRVVVSVPGTQEWNPSTGGNPADLTGNLVTAGGGTSTMTGSVELAMRNAAIPPGAEVMLVGHSQGGMTVADLVSDPGFVSAHHVTHAMVYGSPVDSERLDARVHVLELAHRNDLVPRLDLGDAPALPGPVPGVVLPGPPGGHEQAGPSHTEVTFGDSPGGLLDIGANHGSAGYREALAAGTDPGLLAYEQRLRDAGFLGSGHDASNTTAVDVSIGRRQADHAPA